MKRFKNILYFADGACEAGHALKRTISLADSNEARLTVIDVIDDYTGDHELEKRLGVSIVKLLKDTRLQQLDEMLAPLQQAGHVIYTQVLTGVPFIEVIRAVMRNGFDLLIKEAKTSEGLSEQLLGSTEQHLLRKCPCPVWIDRQNIPFHYTKILAAVDPMREKDEARFVMDLATSLSHSTGADLEVFHAWQLAGESILRHSRARVSIPKTELEQLLKKEQENHRKQLDKLLEHYGMSTSDPGVKLVNTVPSRGILDAAQDADLIVMGTVGRTGIKGLFIGNTAENVMQNTQASILAVKPDGFKSPVA